MNLSPREAAVLVVLGKYARRLRLIPFEDTLEQAIDKVRGALSGSAQRELLQHVEKLEFTGVPSPPVAAEVRKAVEQAWFEQCALDVTYVSGNFMSRRGVDIASHQSSHDRNASGPANGAHHQPCRGHPVPR